MRIRKNYNSPIILGAKRKTFSIGSKIVYNNVRSYTMLFLVIFTFLRIDAMVTQHER